MNIKKFFVALAIMGLLLSCNFRAQADGVAYIDVNKVLNSYTKAQELAADLKVKEAELQKLIADAKKDIKLANISDKQQLEDKYNKELKEKQESYKQQYLNEFQDIQNTVESAVKTVAKNKNVSVVFNKTSVVLGGDDLTDDVITILKGDKEKPDANAPAK
jgi:outer membrane protein